MTGVSQTLFFDVWTLIHKVNSYLEKCEEPVFSEIGVSATQCKILMDLKRRDRPPTITELALSSHRNVNSMSAIIDRMERHNLIKRIVDNRSRASRVRLTSTGMRMADLAVERENKLIQKLLGKSSVEEMQACLSVMEDMSTELTEMFSQKEKRGSTLSKKREITKSKMK